MEKGFEQLRLGDMEHGMAFPVAVIDMRPEEIAAKFGIEFEVSRDGLDYLKAALIRVSSGHQYALVSHLHPNSSGTDILINERRAADVWESPNERKGEPPDRWPF